MDPELGGTPITGIPARDAIDDLVDDELTWSRSGDPYHYNAKCPRCQLEWHGLAKGLCPGETGVVDIAPDKA